MKQQLKSPPMLVALAALFVALSGTSYAVSSLPANSVGKTQLKKNAVTSSRVKDGSLLAADFSPSVQLKGDTGATGATGATGPQGPKGTFGNVTTASLTAAADLADGTKASYSAFCPAGEQAIAGGGRGDDTASQETSMTSSRPAVSAANTEPPADGGTFTGWRITITNLAGGVTTGIRPTVWVMCVPAP